MKTLSAIVIAASFFGSWQPPQKLHDTNFAMGFEPTSGALDIRPTFLTPRNLESACEKFLNAKTSYRPVRENTFELSCEIPPVNGVSENKMLFDFAWRDDLGLELYAVLQARNGQKPSLLKVEVGSALVGALRERLLDAGKVAKPPEGRNAFSETFRWCANAHDGDCMPEDY